jgi:hypothetical protein
VSATPSSPSALNRAADGFRCATDSRDFCAAVACVTRMLEADGCVVLTEIDAQAAMKADFDAQL